MKINIPDGQYDHKLYEKEILDFWQKMQFFKPEYDPKLKKVRTSDEMYKDTRETFSIICPPPNANGNLHLGHMSGYSYQDAMGRFHRMTGHNVLLLPGKDHAGIQTEVVFEKELDKKGIKKQDMGRDKFYEECYRFCFENSETARNQEKKLGLSADYDRELFTLDPKIVKNILNTFVNMYKDELIYRGKRIINWCVRCQSALADIDTEYKDAQTKFYYFKYGFLEPEAEALKIKNEFQNKQIEWKYERSMTKDGLSEMPFAYGEIETYKLNNENLHVMGIGYDKNLDNGKILKGKVIGIQMSLDKQFRIVVAHPDFTGDLDSEINKIFLFESKYYPGAHIIQFAQYPDDKFYTNGFILGTVRPETKFGDTAIAVDPDDKRYAEFVGNTYEVKTINGTAKLKIIADNAVDENFGTGMVKVTPAHSPEDWDIASRHPKDAFPERQVIDFKGRLNHLTGKYEGMTVKQAREAMIPDMKEVGTLIYLDENYENRVRICERCKSPIEPLIANQWFVNTRPLKNKAKKLVEDKLTSILPSGKRNVYLNWMKQEEDWCITRQLWWGYRLPVWYKGKREQYITETGEVKEKIGDKTINSPNDYEDVMYVGLEQPVGEGWYQDEDILDTWFSSGQWPHATLKAYEKDFEKFYPTNVMETGWDILIFWVTRMMMLNPYLAEKEGITEAAKQIPFKHVFLHGLVLDKNGVKMSKSKGNGIDPLEMIEKYGADPLRFSIVMSNKAGMNQRLYEEKVSGNKKFCNKIWNSAKYVLMALENSSDIEMKDLDKDIFMKEKFESEINQAFVEKLRDRHEKTTKYMETFRFGLATEKLYNSFWHEFCDLYIEQSKELLKSDDKGVITETLSMLLAAITLYLKMLHPFIPFVTEKIYQILKENELVWEDVESLMYAEWKI
jgi:valyl-tRNA synthetase